jgi:hypothetical protein
MPVVLTDVIELFGFLLRAIGFLVVGLALGRFLLDAYKKANWQLQMALVLGFFGLLIALTDFASAGSAGAFALGAGISMLTANAPKKDEAPEEVKPL